MTLKVVARTDMLGGAYERRIIAELGGHTTFTKQVAEVYREVEKFIQNSFVGKSFKHLSEITELVRESGISLQRRNLQVFAEIGGVGTIGFPTSSRAGVVYLAYIKEV